MYYTKIVYDIIEMIFSITINNVCHVSVGLAINIDLIAAQLSRLVLKVRTMWTLMGQYENVRVSDIKLSEKNYQLLTLKYNAQPQDVFFPLAF